ncbi:MAG TPA: hypothetical protein VEY71_01015, partial [Chitinophagales bacterium]|nr:hypothetical protein [Chitinophagales bacterium]
MLISKLYVPVLLVLLVCSGCDLINPAEPVPAYIDLRDPELVIPASQAGTQGSASEKISNTWLFLNNRPLGVFNRTGHIPVIGDGENMITAVAGIMENGVAAVRVIYPFYTTDTTIAVLSPNGDIVVDP